MRHSDTKQRHPAGFFRILAGRLSGKKNEETIDELLNGIKAAERRITELATKQVKDLVARISASAVTIDITEALDAYQDNLYGMGVTLYDRHGFHETGILQSLTVEPEIKVTFNGTVSDCNEELSLFELESWSQACIVDLLDFILKDIASGDVTAELKDGSILIRQ